MSKTNIRSSQLINAALFVTAITFASFANATPVHDGDKNKADQMEVRMANATDAEIVVEVKISNEEAKKLVLVVENDRGDELYSKEIDKAGFRYKLRFPKADNILVYIIKLKAKSKALEQYKVITTQRVVEDVTISKI